MKARFLLLKLMHQAILAHRLHRGNIKCSRLQSRLRSKSLRTGHSKKSKNHQLLNQWMLSHHRLKPKPLLRMKPLLRLRPKQLSYQINQLWR